jgi:mannose-6-phosphate isomerase-like protein (cupin superfamily)
MLEAAMKRFELASRAAVEGGETVLGSKDLGTHACYLLYGVLRPGESARELRPGPGHEEIFFVIEGEMRLERGGEAVIVAAGEAFHLDGEARWFALAEGNSPVRYVAAGGHASAGHTH